MATGCGACVDIVYEHQALSVTDGARPWRSYGNRAVIEQPPHGNRTGNM